MATVNALLTQVRIPGCLMLFAGLVGWATAAPAEIGVHLLKLKLRDAYLSEGASPGDVDDDGKMGLVSGNPTGVLVSLPADTPGPRPAKPAPASAGGEFLFFEGEALQVTKRAGVVRPQDLRAHGTVWSNDAHVWWTNSKPGDEIEFTFPVPAAGQYRLGVGMTKAIDYGVVELTLDGKKISGAIDLFNDGVIHTGTVPVGEVHALSAGNHRLGVKIVGANPRAKKAYMFALDYLILHPGDRQALLEAKVSTAKPQTRPRPQGGLKQGNDPNAEPRSPAEQLAGFKVPDGFVVELVSSEAQGLIKPISIAFDDSGRLWTQTAREYPMDNDEAAFRRGGNDQVVVFDTPWAKGVQTPRVFADGLVMPVSVLPYQDRVLVVHGTEVLELRDSDGDGKADQRRTLLAGFGIQDTHTTVHQLARGPGNWIHCSQGCNSSGRVKTSDGELVDFNHSRFARFKPDGTRFELTGAGMNNVWCWATNAEGRVFIHEANDLGYSHAVFERDVTYPSFRKVQHFPESMLHPPTAEGLGLGGTGFSGIAVSEDTARGFPDPWQGVNFVANPITRAINTVSYEVDDTGVYRFSREEDLLTSDDPMFRPVAIEFGPDGCLYVIDWYNRIISHNEVSNDHPARDKVSGRIWRIRHQSQPVAPPPDVAGAPTGALLQHLASGNLWERRAAWHQIVERRATGLVGDLTKALRGGVADDSLKVHLLWCLEELGTFDPGLWRQLLADDNPNLRFQAVRALGTLSPDLRVAHGLLRSLAGDPSTVVVNEVLRFYRETPHELGDEHLAFVRRFQTPEDRLPDDQVKGWKGTYLALGGAYEKAFTNLLVSQVIHRGAAPRPRVDLAKWNQVLETHPPMDPEVEGEIQGKIERLATAHARRGGDVAKGASHYMARCALCHGGLEGLKSIAPPLNGGEARTPEAVLTAVLLPNAAAENVFHSYRIIKKDGTLMEGLRSDVTAEGITLTAPGGHEVLVAFGDIRNAGYISGKSLMNEGTAEGMSDEELLDLISYIRSLK